MNRDERAMVAGLDGLVFGALILLAGTVLIVNAWSVIDTRLALDGAAREYLRAYTEAGDPTTALADGQRAARASLAGRGQRLDVDLRPPDAGRFGPCALAQVEMRAAVPAARLPFIGAFGTTVVRVSHTELIDAHREVVSGATYDAAATPCGG